MATAISEPPKSAPANVYTIPPGRPFLDCLAAAILAGDLPVPGGAAPSHLDLTRFRLYLPTRRAARGLQDAFLRVAGGTALLLPRVRPIGEGEEDESLIAGDVDGVVADPEAIRPAIGALERRLALSELVLAWTEALRRQEERSADQPFRSAAVHSPAQAALLAAELARLMDKLETEGVAFGSIATLVPEAFAEHWGRTLDFLKIITEHWPGHLAERKLASPAARRSALLTAEARFLADRPPASPVIVAGVTGSIPATAMLMRVVAGLPNGALVLPGLDLDLSAAAWTAVAGAPAHPQHRLARLLAGLGIDRSAVLALPGAAPAPRLARRARIIAEAMLPPELTDTWADIGERIAPLDAAEALADVTVVAAASAEDEAEAVALILRQAAETAGRTAALVTPDRVLARRVATRLEAFDIRVDDSAGRPFGNTTPGAFLDLVVAVVARRFSAVATMALLKHPLTRLGLPVAAARARARALELAAFRGPYLGRDLAGIRAAIEAFDADARRPVLRRHPAAGRWWERDRDGVRALLDRVEEAFAPLLGLSTGRHPIADLTAAHVAVAEALARDETGSTDALYQGEAGATASQLLAGLMNVAQRQPSIGLAHYPDFYRSLAGSEPVRPRVPVHPRIAIWGPFEARLQRPDVVVLGGLVDGVWPRTPEPDPWLNRPMLATLGLPAPETRVGDEAHDFTGLLGAEAVFLTRASKIDGVPKVASRWLLRLDAVLGGLGLGGSLEAKAKPTWLAWVGERDRRVERPPMRRPEPRPPIEARPRMLPVTRIETFLANPYAIFAGDILRLEPMPGLGADPDQSLRGQVLHEALNRFTRAFPDRLPAEIDVALMAEIDAVLGDLAAEPRIATFWRQRFRRFGMWFAETEPGRREGIVRIAAEVAGALVIATPAGPFRLTARADRIDIAADGALTLYDYKSGTPPTARDVSSLRSPQLPLEAAIAAEGGFAGLAAARVAGLGYVGASGGEPPGIERMIDAADPVGLGAEARQRLIRLITLFDDPSTPYRAQRRGAFASIHRFDDYAHLARVKEWGSEEADE